MIRMMRPLLAGLIMLPCTRAYGEDEPCGPENQPPQPTCRDAFETEVDANCRWEVESRELEPDFEDPEGDALVCRARPPFGDGLAMRPLNVRCTDRCGAPSQARCEPLVVPRDRMAAQVEVERPRFTLPMTDGYQGEWVKIRNACQMTWWDNCTSNNRVQHGIMDVVSSDLDEEIRGGPGHFKSGAMLADWHRFVVNTDRETAEPRIYTFRYGFLDAQRNFSVADCEIRVIDGPTCDDGEHNGDETGVDCGGAQCPACDNFDTCPGTRWVGVLREGHHECPNTVPTPDGEFRSSALFDASDVAPGQEDAVPWRLRRYCVFDWTATEAGTQPDAQDFGPLNEVMDQSFGSYSRDCMGAGALETDVARALLIPLFNEFTRQVDGLRPLPDSADGEPIEVRVAIADTSPVRLDGEASFGTSGHGFAMGRLVLSLTCPPPFIGGPCLTHLVSHLSLPRIERDEVSVEDGGYYGFQSEVAHGVFGAFKHWRFSPLETQPRLVVNLSLGWDPHWGGAIDPQEIEPVPPHIASVRDAITHVACHGGLVIAAAGNHSDGPVASKGPMFPGGWEVLKGPNPEQCVAFEAGSDYDPYPDLPIFGPTIPPYGPLVYAAGGVRGDDEPLTNTRPRGRPRLAAPAYMAVAPFEFVAGVAPTDINTGTSVASAVVSTAAAVVWAYRPSLTNHEVMQIIYASAVNLGNHPDTGPTRPDFCLGMSGCTTMPIRRVSICRALAAACPTPLERCPATPPDCLNTPPAYLGEPTIGPGVYPDMQDALVVAGVVPIEADGTELVASVPLDPMCRLAPPLGGLVQLMVVDPADPVGSPCPDREYFNALRLPWAGPQPGPKNPCPSCIWSTNTGRLELYIDKDLPEYVTLTDGKVNVIDKFDQIAEGIDLNQLSDMKPLEAGDVVTVDDVFTSVVDYTHATVTFTVHYDYDGHDNVMSAESELIVWD